MASSFVIHQMYLFEAFTKNSVCSCEKVIELFILGAYSGLIHLHLYNSKALHTYCPFKEEDSRNLGFDFL